MQVQATEIYGLQAKLQAAAPLSKLEMLLGLQDHVLEFSKELRDARVSTNVLDQEVRELLPFLDKVDVCSIVQKPGSIPSQQQPLQKLGTS